MYKLVIFDFDGTLADSARWLAAELDPLTERFGLRRVSQSEIAELRGCDTRSVLRRLGVPGWKLPLIARHLQKRVSDDVEKISLFPGAKALIRKLAGEGVVLGVVSSNSAANVRRILGPEAAALIEHYECGASLFGKAARFRKLVRRAGMRACDTLCIGDETRDIEAAKAAGLACGAVAWGYATRELLASFAPTWLFDTPDDIAHHLAPA